MLRPRKSTRAAFDNFLLAHYERSLFAEYVVSRPFLLFIDPSSLCQLQCPMCPTGLENAKNVGHGRTYYRRPRGLLTREIFDSVLAELGETLFFVHLYNWGEPLLNPNSLYFINKLVENDISVEINTNLSLRLSDAYIGEIVDSGVDRIEASIDGFSQGSYERYRVNGSYDLARDNIIRLARARDRARANTEIVWNFLVFKFNEDEVESAKLFCEEHGIEFVRREAAISEALREEFLPSYREGEDLQGFYEQRARLFNPDSILQRPRISCGWHYFYSIVNADGSVSPCCAPWESDWDFGSVKPGISSFSDIWNGALFQKSRADVSGQRLLNRLARSGAMATVKKVDDFVKQGSICEGCQMSNSILELYAHRGEAVIDHYLQTMKGKNFFMDKAFELLRTNDVGFANHYRQVPPIF